MTCIEIGDDEEGKPRIIIHATREELMQLDGNAGSLLYREVEVRPAQPAETQTEPKP